MTHFRVDIQLPLCFNSEDGGGKIPEELFLDTHIDLLNMVGGIHTSKQPVLGSWLNTDEKNKRYDDRCIVYSVLVESEDKVTVNNITKIKELIDYKKVMMKRFKQHKIFMVATRCTWL